MKHIGLFEGIGGFSLAARWAGWETVAWCEIDTFCQKVLSFHFPEAQQHGDIKTTDFSIYRGKCDILTGGFPCQPYSAAGKRLGKNDDRHLWPEMLRAIREIQPTWIVGENVRGFTNWNGGVVFDEVQADLEALGYEVQSFILPACAVNAPHRRDRVWIIAYSNSQRQSGRREQLEPIQQGQLSRSDSKKHVPNATSEGLERVLFGKSILLTKRTKKGTVTNPANVGHEQPRSSRQRGAGFADCDCRLITDTHSIGHSGKEHGQTRPRFDSENDTRPGWDNFPTQPPICVRNDGLSERLDGITFPKWRNESIKAYGNAIVPQVAYEIFKVINQMEQ